MPGRPAKTCTRPARLLWALTLLPSLACHSTFFLPRLVLTHSLTHDFPMSCVRPYTPHPPPHSRPGLEKAPPSGLGLNVELRGTTTQPSHDSRTFYVVRRPRPCHHAAIKTKSWLCMMCVSPLHFPLPGFGEGMFTENPQRVSRKTRISHSIDRI